MPSIRCQDRADAGQRLQVSCRGIVGIGGEDTLFEFLDQRAELLEREQVCCRSTSSGAGSFTVRSQCRPRLPNWSLKTGRWRPRWRAKTVCTWLRIMVRIRNSRCRMTCLRERLAASGACTFATKFPRNSVASARASSRFVLICASAIRRVLNVW